MEEKKIVLVEDDPDHADLITEGLVEGDNETEIILVQDGMAAVDYFHELGIEWNGRIDCKIMLVILDLNLPKVSGMEVLKLLKKNSKYNKIPVSFCQQVQIREQSTRCIKMELMVILSNPLLTKSSLKK